MIELTVTPGSSRHGNDLQHDIRGALPWLNLSEGLQQAREQGKPVLCLAERPHGNSAQRLALFLEHDPHLGELITDSYVPVLSDPGSEPELADRILVAARQLERTVSAPLLAVLSDEGLPLVTYCNLNFEGDDQRPSLLNLLRTTSGYYRQQQRECRVEARGLQQTTTARPALNLFLPAWQLLRQPDAQLLDRLITAGIHDQLGGGFHRAARMSGWGVPHFEKTALQNAAMSTVLLRSQNEATRRYATACATFALRCLQADSAGLASDTPYYTWSSDEVLEALPAAELQLVGLHYRISASSSRHVLNQVRTVSEATDLATGSTTEQAVTALERGKQRLLTTRLQRSQPGQLPAASPADTLLTISQLLQSSLLEPELLNSGQLLEQLTATLNSRQPGSVHGHAAALHALSSASRLTSLEGNLKDAQEHHRAVLQQFRQAGDWYYDREHTRPVPPGTIDHESPSVTSLLQALQAERPQLRS